MRIFVRVFIFAFLGTVSRVATDLGPVGLG